MAHKQRLTNGPTPSASASVSVDNTVRPLPSMKTTSLDEQDRRRFLGENWQPNGFHRYRYSEALLHGMAVLGGWDDNGGANPDRYRPLDGGA